LDRDFKKLLDKAGLPSIRFHDLRHTAASIMLKYFSPVTVSRVLGHSKSSITLNIYGHLLPTAIGEVAETMDKVIAPIPMEISVVNCTQTAPRDTANVAVQ